MNIELLSPWTHATIFERKKIDYSCEHDAVDDAREATGTCERRVTAIGRRRSRRRGSIPPSFVCLSTIPERWVSRAFISCSSPHEARVALTIRLSSLLRGSRRYPHRCTHCIAVPPRHPNFLPTSSTSGAPDVRLSTYFRPQIKPRGKIFSRGDFCYLLFIVDLGCAQPNVSLSTESNC